MTTARSVPTARTPRGDRSSPRARVAAAMPTCLAALALVVLALGWVGVARVVVVAGRPGPSWPAAAVLALAAVALLARRWRAAGRRGRAGRTAAGIVHAVVALVATAALLVTVAVDLLPAPTRYQVLEPAEEDGCRVIVRVTSSSLLPTGHEVLTATGDWAVARLETIYLPDPDDSDPFADGEYVLHWFATGDGMLKPAPAGYTEGRALRCDDQPVVQPPSGW